MAYEWRDAQKTVKVAKKEYLTLKHIMSDGRVDTSANQTLR
jgi:hypothetical protein